MGKKVKPSYKRPQYVGKLKATGEQKPVKRPAPKVKSWAVWDGPLSLFA